MTEGPVPEVPAVSPGDYRFGYGLLTLEPPYLYGRDLAEALHSTWRSAFLFDGDRLEVHLQALTLDSKVRFLAHMQVRRPFSVELVVGVRASDGLLAVQLTDAGPPVQVVLSLLSRLLRPPFGSDIWRVAAVVDDIGLPDWLGSVTHLERFKFLLNLPNPHWYGNEIVRAILGDLNAEVVELSGRARAGESLDLTASSFRQLLDHVSRNYGSTALSGKDRDGNDTTLAKVRGAPPGVLTKRDVRAASETGAAALVAEALKTGPTKPRTVQLELLED